MDATSVYSDMESVGAAQDGSSVWIVLPRHKDLEAQHDDTPQSRLQQQS